MLHGWKPLRPEHRRSAFAKIAQAMVALGDAGALAQLYAALTSNPATAAWNAFQGAVRALRGGVTSDDPFAAAPPAP
jgi:hypothetical protein